MITQRDIDDFKDSYDYWEKPQESYPTPFQMVKEYNLKGNPPTPELMLKLIDEEFNEWSDEVDEFKDSEKALGWAYSAEKEFKEILDLLFVLYGYCLSRGWDADEGFYRLYLNNLKRMYWDDGLIHRDDNGKILKSPTAPKINLSDLV